MLKVWAIPRSLATTSGIVVYFLFLEVLRCFSSPGYLYRAYIFNSEYNRHYSMWVSPFGNLRFKACLTAPRSLSQSTTSFVGILRQGIRYVRLSNFLRKMRQNQRFFLIASLLFFLKWTKIFEINSKLL